jgi:putative transposase
MKWKNYYQPNIIYFFSSRITEKIHILRKERYKPFVTDSLYKYMNKYQVSLYGYAIMPNHIHILISAPTAEGIQRCVQHTLRESSLKITHELKGVLETQYASQAQQILDTFAKHANGKAHYAVWKEQARGIPIWSKEVFETKLGYTHENPMRWQLVSDPAEYKFSSFRTIYLGEEGILPITPSPFL